MRAKFLIITMVISLIPATVLHAHAVVIRSSLDSRPPQPNQAAPVSLIFNSEIETSLSSVKLVTLGDRKQAVPMRHGKQRGEIVVELPPLAPGEYALQYKVFAADGHLTEDVVKFFVQEDN